MQCFEGNNALNLPPIAVFGRRRRGREREGMDSKGESNGEGNERERKMKGRECPQSPLRHPVIKS